MKRTIKLTVQLGLLVHGKIEKVVELDLYEESTEEETREEIDEYAEEWALQQIDWGWEFVDQ